LVEESPRPEERLEGGIIASVDFVEEPRATVKVLETCFVKLFANERNLVAGLGRREDRVNSNPFATTLDTQSRVNQEYLH